MQTLEITFLDRLLRVKGEYDCDAEKFDVCEVATESDDDITPIVFSLLKISPPSNALFDRLVQAEYENDRIVGDDDGEPDPGYLADLEYERRKDMAREAA